MKHISRKLLAIVNFILTFNLYFINIDKLYANDINNLPYLQPNIKIAIVVPLTGKYADYGKNSLIAANLAMHDYLKIHPSISTKVQLIPFDDKCDPKLALSIAKEIIKDRKIKIIIGHNCTQSTLIASKIYAKQGILHIIPTITDPKITEQGIPTLFRMCGKRDIQGQQIADYINKKFNDLKIADQKTKSIKIAILHNEELANKLLAEQVQESLAIFKIAPTLYQSMDLEKLNTHSNITNLVKKLKKLDINLIFFSGFYKDTVNLLQIMHTYNLNIPLITDENILTPAFLKLLPNYKLIAGTIMSFQKIDLNNFKSQPNQSIFAYAAMQVALNTINFHLNNNNFKHKNYHINNLNGRILADWLHHNKVPTILGEKSWDTNGEIINGEFNMYIWDDQGHYWALN